MKPDEVLRACGARGGVIGISAAAHTTLTEKHPLHSIESVMEHFEYVASLVGIDHVAFGPDTFFGDHVGMHRFFAKQFSLAASRGGKRFREVEYVDGIENPGEAFPNIVRWLVRHGYRDADIAKAIGGNVMRALAEIWPR
jgi:membrane dipeptidase